jgi:hypothetical protein
MHIVVIAWLYVTATMSLAFSNGWAGAAFFVSMGLAPVVLYGWLALRRRRAARQAVNVPARNAPPR